VGWITVAPSLSKDYSAIIVEDESQVRLKANSIWSSDFSYETHFVNHVNISGANTNSLFQQVTVGAGTVVGPLSAFDNNIGGVNLRSAASSSGYSALFTQNKILGLRQNHIEISFRIGLVNLPTVANNFNTKVGVADEHIGSDIHGVYVLANASSPNWQLLTRNNLGISAVDSGIPLVANEVLFFKIIIPVQGLVSLYINGVLVAQSSFFIPEPNVFLKWVLGNYKVSGANSTNVVVLYWRFDYIWSEPVIFH
jgi:hypothetical protein